MIGHDTATKWVVYAASMLCVVIGTTLSVLGIYGGATTLTPTPSGGTRCCWELYKTCLLEPGSPSTSYCADMCDVLCRFHTWRGLLTAGMLLCAIGVAAPACRYCLLLLLPRAAAGPSMHKPQPDTFAADVSSTNRQRRASDQPARRGSTLGLRKLKASTSGGDTVRGTSNVDVTRQRSSVVIDMRGLLRVFSLDKFRAPSSSGAVHKQE